ncbi:MAG: AMP-binding protein [Syntrophales bacterium]|nr:AMP-binding protein [Syntrophales bacterium]HOG07051.1 AMP-binding protein [Syntrophales bacterium]HOS76668.1 AMP-binding protein [Syntrophales bacterium]HPB70440.1 AMP-binding protein [Syntrophales bacterium]HQN25305.1 AMP-binding protein [Syntrophales bacterium]
MAEGFDAWEHENAEVRRTRKFSRMCAMLEAGYGASSRLRRILDETGLMPADFSRDLDLERLPVISRETLIQWELSEPPYGGLADPAADVDRIFISPGPVYEPHLSEADMLWARAYHAAGIGKADRVLNAFSYHLVAAGLTFHGGLRRVGATVVPSGTAGAQNQVELIRDLGITAYTGTPSFLMAIIRKAEEMGYDWEKDFRLKRACFAAEPLRPALRETFTRDYGIDTYQMYGATEVGDVAYECRQKSGWHICEEVFVEICDPESGRRLPAGELGQVVVTRFNDIFFLMRFGTGDLSRLIETPCDCGRTAYRLDGIAGRVGEAVKVRGMFVAPSQIHRLAQRFSGKIFRVHVRREGDRDLLVVRIEGAPGTQGDGWAGDEEFKRGFRDLCTVGVDRLEWVPKGTLAAADRQLVDERDWR